MRSRPSLRGFFFRERIAERRINESGIEQTGVAFDVILECRHDADPFPSANVPVRLQPRLQPESGLFSFAYRLSDRPFEMLLNATLSGDCSGSAHLLSLQRNRPTTAAGLPCLRHCY